MRRLILSMAALAAVMLIPLAAKGNDTQLAQEIARRLEHAKQTGHLLDFSLSMEVLEGSVELSGHVASHQQQTLVLEIARRVPGVRQVVNGIDVRAPQNRPRGGNPAWDSAPYPQSLLANLEQQALPAEPGETPVGSGRVQVEQASMPIMTAPRPIAQRVAQVQTARRQVQATAQQMPAATQLVQSIPQPVQARPARPIHPGPQQRPQYLAEAYGGQAYGGQPDGAPQYTAQAGPVPIGSSPAPAYMPAGGAGVAPARYDNPQLPAYSWPAYAAHPNYAAVTYPKQYSASAWPYIGPFYPYPQVPLGWRKVTLEWDDGWWFLNFEDH